MSIVKQESKTGSVIIKKAKGPQPMHRKRTPQRSDQPPTEQKYYGHNVFKGAWHFGRNLLHHDFSTRMGGVSNGLILVTEAFGGALSLSLPLLLTPLGGFAYCALAGAGLYGINYGLRGVWNSAESAWDKTFPGFNPLKKIRLRAENIVHAISQKPFMQKLHAKRKRLAEKIAQNPFFIKMARRPLAQKFLNSRVANCRHGLTQAQRDVFLAGIAIQGTLATLAFSAFIFAHVAAAPITAGSLLSGTVLFATYQAITSPIGLYCYTKTLMRIARNRKNAKKSKEGKPAAESTLAAPPSLETNTPPVLAGTSAAFNREAGKLETNEDEPRRNPGVANSANNHGQALTS